MTLTQKLLEMIPRMEVVEFAGLARVLKVQLAKENPDYNKDEPVSDTNLPAISRDFVDVLDETLANFDELPRGRKREIISLVKDSIKKEKKKKVKSDADNTIDSEATIGN